MQTTLHPEAPDHLSEAEFTAILLASHWEQLRDKALPALRVFGVDDFMLKIDVTLPNGSVKTNLLGTLSETLLNRFRFLLPAEADPVGRRMLESGLPCNWEIDEVYASSGSDTYLQLLMHGVKRGISMAVRTERVASRIDFYSKATGPFPGSAALRANLLLLALYLHEAARLLSIKEAAAEHEVLSGRELECLRFAAVGKTGKEIGTILGIAPRTVYFHLQNIAKKFNVYSTRQAISHAVAIGLIKPGN